MSFNPDLSKQAQELIFSRKLKRPTHPLLVFNNDNVSQTFSQKRLGVILDFKLTFEEHLNNVLAKVNKAVALYANFEIYYQKQRKLLYTKLSFGHIWTIVMSRTIEPLIKKTGIYST